MTWNAAVVRVFFCELLLLRTVLSFRCVSSQTLTFLTEF